MEKEFRSEVYESEVDVFFASLTQRLTLSDPMKVSPLDFFKSPEGLKVSGGSPQSTLGGMGSRSGRSSSNNSPPTIPFETRDDTLGLIYAAAGQVRNVEDPLLAALNARNNLKQQVSRLQNYKNALYARQQMIWEQQLQNINRSELLNNSAWPPLQQAKGHVKPNYQAVPLQRKHSAGTGVFIPRVYNTPTSTPPRTRIQMDAPAPAKLVQALNNNIETRSPACPRIHCNYNPSSVSISQQSYDALMARRRALLDQQQISMARNDDIAARSLEACLPQEWSY